MNETERMESQDKMNPADVGLFARMLGIRELPVNVIEAYWNRKKLMDRIDALVTPGTLVDIIFACGFNVETMRFEEPVTPIATEFTDKIESASSGEEVKIELEPIPIGTACKAKRKEWGGIARNVTINGFQEIDGEYVYSILNKNKELFEGVKGIDIKV